MLFDKMLQYINDKYSEKIGGLIFKDLRKADIILTSLTFVVLSLSLFLIVALREFMLGVSVILAEAAVLLYPWLTAYAKVKEYESQAIDASLTISIAAYVMSVLGKDLLTVLRALAGKGNKVADVELRILLTKVKVLGSSLRTALSERSNALPNVPLSYLYKLYVTAGELGVSLQARLGDFVKDLLTNFSQTIENRINVLTELSEAILSLYVLLPMLAMGLSILEGTQLQLLLVPLLFSPGLYFLVASYSISPRMTYNLSTLDLLVAVSGLTGSLYLALTLKNVGASILLFGLSVGLWFYVMYYLPAERLFNYLPLLSTTIGDKVRLGHNFIDALNKSLEDAMKLDPLLKRAVRIYKTGALTFMNDFVSTAELAYEGSLAGVYDELSRIYSYIIAARRNYERKALVFLVLAVVAPLILFYELNTFSGILGADRQVYGSLLGVLSFALSVLFSKAYKGTIFYFPLYIAVGIETLILSALWA